MKKAVLASGNAHKVHEIGIILRDFDITLETMKDAGFEGDIEENGTTFEENSLIKAEAVMRAIGAEVTLADDSGLEVDALNGAPGVYSARYAGEGCNYEDNNDKLLEALTDVPYEKRTATFVTVITYLTASGEKIVARGEVKGHIGFERKGGNGFGYDPLFIVDDMDKTYAEMNDEEKSSLSHRAEALKILKLELAKR
ncbi:MAG: RdgB/HAM1 family non-canonical purine NTP pyrophosphatase [Clostridia bacterium]|nr:RdgB/HAM1 family non-canonical purine NTP pyrophosphatase [Clostridia bacterium]